MVMTIKISALEDCLRVNLMNQFQIDEFLGIGYRKVNSVLYMKRCQQHEKEL